MYQWVCAPNMVGTHKYYKRVDIYLAEHHRVLVVGIALKAVRIDPRVLLARIYFRFVLLAPVKFEQKRERSVKSIKNAEDTSRSYLPAGDR